jgi:hypothetical protein
VKTEVGDVTTSYERRLGEEKVAEDPTKCPVVLVNAGWKSAGILDLMFSQRDYEDYWIVTPCSFERA